MPCQPADADSGGCTLVVLKRFLAGLTSKFALNAGGHWQDGLLFLEIFLDGVCDGFACLLWL